MSKSINPSQLIETRIDSLLKIGSVAVCMSQILGDKFETGLELDEQGRSGLAIIFETIHGQMIAESMELEKIAAFFDDLRNDEVNCND